MCVYVYAMIFLFAQLKSKRNRRTLISKITGHIVKNGLCGGEEKGSESGEIGDGVAGSNDYGGQEVGEEHEQLLE